MQDVTENLEKQRHKQKKYYDQKAKALPSLEVGDKVMMQLPSKKWEKATIVQKQSGLEVTLLLIME